MTYRHLTGTTQESFALGLAGPSLRGGVDAPVDAVGSDGDLYVRVGATPGLYCRQAGSWRELHEEQAFIHQPIARGDILQVDPTTTLVTVYRNPYTIDTIDLSTDETDLVSIDAQPTNEYTTVQLPGGTEGQSLAIKDVSGRYAAFEVRITGLIDDEAQASIQDISAKLDLLYSTGSWRIVGR